MVYKKFVEIGKVVFIALGPFSGKLAVIVNVIDQNRLLVDGPRSGVPRVVINLKQVQLTKFTVPIAFGARTGTVRKNWDKEDISNKWSETSWAKKIKAKAAKAQMSDFDRFRVVKLKQKRRAIINREVNKLKKEMNA